MLVDLISRCFVKFSFPICTEATGASGGHDQQKQEFQGGRRDHGPGGRGQCQLVTPLTSKHSPAESLPWQGWHEAAGARTKRVPTLVQKNFTGLVQL